MRQNVAVRKAPLRHHRRAYLAQPNAVPPARAGEREVVVFFSVQLRKFFGNFGSRSAKLRKFDLVKCTDILIDLFRPSW